MDDKALISKFTKKLKRVFIVLVINLLAALGYSYFTKNMNIISFSNTLTIIGGIYAVLGGASYLGGMGAEIGYEDNFDRSSYQRLADKHQRTSFVYDMVAYSFVTMLVAFLFKKLL